MTRLFGERFTVALGKDLAELYDIGPPIQDALAESDHDRVRQIAQAQDDIDALDYLVDYADAYIRRLADRRIEDSVFNADSLPLRDPTPDWIRKIEELRTRTFGKTIVIQNADDTIVVYRIAQANAGCIEGGYRILNRLAPVAEALISAQPGDDVCVPNAEDGYVLATSLTDNPAVGERRDFGVLKYHDLDLHEPVDDMFKVRETIEHWRDRISQFLETHDWDQVSDEVSSASTQAPLELDARGSLGAQFYTRTTRAQEDIIRTQPSGVIFVEGIAGSGKTSIALGRTKALCDRRFESQDSEYWDDFFTPETAIGFVLNSQLVEYLKETRDALYISDMPVSEYNALRQRLVRQRAQLLEIELTPSDRPSYTRSRDSASGLDGSMELLHTVDSMTAAAYAQRVESRLAKLPTLANATERQTAVANFIWNRLAAELRKVLEPLKGSSSDGRLKWNAVGKDLENVHEKVTRYLDAQRLWLTVPVKGEWISEKSPDALIETLFRNEIPVAVENADGAMKPLLSKAALIDKLFSQRHKLYDSSDPDEPLKEADKNDITNLLDNRRLQVPVNGRWRRVIDHQQRAREALAKSDLYVADGTGSGEWRRAGAEQIFSDVGRKPAKLLRDRIKRTLLADLRLPTLALDALRNQTAEFGGAHHELAKTLAALRARLEEKHLAEHDIDLFLGIASLISINSNGKLDTVAQPSYYSTVFIDEVQDFTEIQVFLMGFHADPRRSAITVVGDFGQQLYYNRVKRLDACFPHIAGHKMQHVQLLENKRQEGSPQLAAFSRWFREAIVEESATSEAAGPPSIGGALQLTIGGSGEMTSEVEKALGELMGDESVAIICPCSETAEALEERLRDVVESYFRESKFSTDNRDLTRPYYVHFTTPTATKGLEFDFVIVPHFERFDWEDPIQVHCAYVAITRAASRLYIMAEETFEGTPLAGCTSSTRTERPERTEQV